VALRPRTSMSDAQKWPRAEALEVAAELTAALGPCCERLEIAGSLRRGKAHVGDVEILYVPTITARADPADLFGTVIQVDAAAEQLDRLLAQNVITPRLSAAGFAAWGERNKLAVHVASGIPVDFFATTLENWWVSLVVRTGSLECNLRLTIAARERGRTLLAYGCGVKKLSTGEVTAATSERDVFDLCGVRYLEPEDRNA
jgi:DNA polymerase/3'-5' exonuclease PolX